MSRSGKVTSRSARVVTRLLSQPESASARMGTSDRWLTRAG
jgi:hypothetical protein